MELEGRGRGGRRRALRGSWLASSLGWGLLWAPLLGVWAVFPHFLRTQRVHPAGFEEWLLLATIAVTVFVGYGVIGSLVAWSLLRLWAALRTRAPSDPGWACALSVPLCLPVLYFLVAACTELTIFSSLVGLGPYRPFFWIAAAAYALLCILSLLLYGAVVRRSPRPRLTPLTLSCLLALVGGLGLAPIWGEPAIDAKAAAQEARPLRDAARPPAPLLFVGVDSGSWKVLRPLLDRGRAPTLRRLIDDGFSGEMRAAWPHPIWSAPAWAAILTGYPREQTGIYQELAASASGLPPFQIPLEFDFLLDPLYLVEYRLGARSGLLRLTPFPKSALLRRPVWQLLHAAGLKVGVVRFRFTFPADDEASFVISDNVGKDIWQVMGVWTETVGSVAPVEMAPTVLSTFAEPSRSAEALVSSSLPRGGPAASPDALVTPAESLRIAADIDTRTIDASLNLLRSQQNIAAFFVYIGGFDTVCHAFWRYRFPKEFPEESPDDEAVREFGPVIDRYLEAVDGWIGRLIEAYAQPPNIVVVADHGAQALHGNRNYSGAHSPRDGIFVAAGPGIPHRRDPVHLSYYDVAPGVLELMGFAPLADMPGASFLRDAPGEETRVGKDAAARSSRDG